MSNAWIAWLTLPLAVALLISFVVVRVLGHSPKRTIVTDVVQGVIAGGVLAYFTANLAIDAKLRSIQTTVNGWRTTTLERSQPGEGILLRAAQAKDVAALNVPEEQVYWEAFVDGAGQKLNGQHEYALRFPPGGLPPNDASWSLTMGDSGRRMVENPMHRYSVGGKSGLAPNADGSLEVFIQHTAPAAPDSNWLPAPEGDFMLWLRVYQPGATILNGAYGVPPVVEVK